MYKDIVLHICQRNHASNTFCQILFLIETEKSSVDKKLSSKYTAHIDFRYLALYVGLSSPLGSH